MIYILIILFLFSCENILPQESVSKSIAVTIDDLPMAYGSGLTEEVRQEAFYKVLRTLKHHGISCFGFAIGKSVSTEREELLRNFVRQGHVLGNHSFSHPDLNKTYSDDYTADIENCQSIIEPLGGKKYFRYPYLRWGNNAERKDSVRKWLDTNGYTVVPVTVDNNEWIYNRDYVDALTDGDSLKAAGIGDEYAVYMVNTIEHYDSLGLSVKGSPVKHILLLHMNPINAGYLDTILTNLASSGWQFITVEDALSDPLFQMKENYLGDRGKSYIERILESD